MVPKMTLAPLYSLTCGRGSAQALGCYLSLALWRWLAMLLLFAGAVMHPGHTYPSYPAGLLADSITPAAFASDARYP